MPWVLLDAGQIQALITKGPWTSLCDTWSSARREGCVCDHGLGVGSALHGTLGGSWHTRGFMAHWEVHGTLGGLWHAKGSWHTRGCVCLKALQSTAR